MNNTTETVQNVEKTVSLIDKIAHYLGSLSDLASKGNAYMQALGLSHTQSYVVIAIVALVALLGVFKFLKIITKVLIFGLIVWIILSLVGIL